MDKLKVTETSEVEKIFQCDYCDFKSNSKQGLGVHIKRKHTKYSEEVVQTECDVCDEKFQDCVGKQWSKKEIEEHKLSHSYQCSSKLNYKCDECEFWGPNRLTMQVHIKKFHSEKVICGLCDLEVKSLHDLELHSITCETYRCFVCEKKFKTLSEIKQHLTNEHKGKFGWVKHSKVDRHNSNFFDTVDHSTKKLFGKKKN